MLKTLGGGVTKFVHFKPDEQAVAERWVNQSNLNGTITWDVKLAREPGRSPANAPANQAELFTFLQQFRIDAVVETENKVYLIEFKDRVRMSGIGQLVNYERLYKEQYQPKKPLGLIYVAGADDTQVRTTAEFLGIVVEIV